jgi:hypothetical protein
MIKVVEAFKNLNDSLTGEVNSVYASLYLDIPLEERRAVLESLIRLGGKKEVDEFQIRIRFDFQVVRFALCIHHNEGKKQIIIDEPEWSRGIGDTSNSTLVIE